MTSSDATHLLQVKNRESAARSRMRKQAYTTELEAQVRCKLFNFNTAHCMQAVSLLSRTLLQAGVSSVNRQFTPLQICPTLLDSSLAAAGGAASEAEHGAAGARDTGKQCHLKHAWVYSQLTFLLPSQVEQLRKQNAELRERAISDGMSSRLPIVLSCLLPITVQTSLANLISYRWSSCASRMQSCGSGL